MKLGALLFAVPLLAAQNTAVVEGTAYNRVTRAGVGGVTIKLAATGNRDKQLYSARTDAAGHFRIEGVAEGDYAASFDAPQGFDAPDRWDPECRPFHVAAATGAFQFDVRIMPLGSVRGRVVDPDGHPVPRTRVELFRVHYAGGSILTTDAEGRFSEGGLVPGQYQLRARPVLPGTPLAEKPESVTPLPAKPPEGEHWIWAPTYFPNAIEIGGAETITVREGSDLAGYEIRLRAAPVYRFAGIALDDQGHRAGGAVLSLDSEIGWGRAEARVTAAPDGAFEFPAVRAGQWNITAELKRGKTRLLGFTQLMMPKHDVEDATIRMAAPFNLPARVEGAGQSQAAVYLVPASHGSEALGSPQKDGSVLIEDVYPGAYRIAVFAKVPGAYLKSILLGTDDVTGQDVLLGPDSPPIRAVFKPNPARVQGAVENGAGLRVVLLDADQDHFIPGQNLHVEIADAEGRFTMEGVRPGVYYALAFAIVNVESGGVMEAVFKRGLSRQAQTLNLSEGETATVKLTATPWPE